MSTSGFIKKVDTVPSVTAWRVQTGLARGFVLRGSMRGGYADAPVRKRDIATLTAMLLDEGTRRYSAAALQDKLQHLGATVSFSCKPMRIEFSVTGLSESFDEVVGLLSDMLRTPRFAPPSFESAKARLAGLLHEATSDTRVLGKEALLRTLFEPSHPHHMLPPQARIRALRNISRSDVLKHHARLSASGDVRLLVAGDVSEPTLSDAIRKHFARTPVSWAALHNIPTLKSKAPRAHVLTVHEKASVDVFWGAPLSLTREHPHYAPLLIALEILGGGFMGRLMQEIREKRGLTYGIYSRLEGFSAGLPGYWSIWGTFAPDVCSGAVVEVEKVIADLRNEGVTEKEVGEKKEKIAGAFTVALSSAEELSALLLPALEEGRGETYVSDFLRAVKAVSHADVMQAISTYIAPSKLSRMCAGSVDAELRPLTSPPAS